MRNIFRTVLPHRGHRLAVLGTALAVAATATVWLATTTPGETSPGARDDTIQAPRAPVGPGALPSSHPPKSPPGPAGVPTGAGETPTNPQGPPTGPRPGQPPRTRTSPPGSQLPDDLLKRQDPVPDGVADQIEFFIGGGDGCGPGDGSGRPHVFTLGQPEIPGEVTVCFDGFLTTAPLTVTVTGPTGTATTGILPANRDRQEGYSFPLVPGTAVGRYRVSARQDGRSATSEITVRRAGDLRLWVSPKFVDPGDDVHVYLGGFPPGRPALIHFYAGDLASPRGDYRTSFTVPVDRNGEGHAIVRTKSNDKRGSYWVISSLAPRSPGAANNDFFVLRGPGDPK